MSESIVASTLSANAQPRGAIRPAEALFLLYVCILPLHWSPLPFNLQWADLLFPVLFVAAFAARPAIRPTTLDVLVAVYVLGAIPSFLSTPDRRASAIQFAKDVYMALLYVTVVATAARGTVLSRVGRVIAWTGVTVAAISLGALALFYVSGIVEPRLGYAVPLPYVGTFYRLYGTFPSAEYLVNFLVFASPFAIAELRQATAPEARVSWTLGLSGMAAAALAAIAHGIVGLLAAVTFDLAATWRRHRRAIVRVLIVATVAVALLANLLLVFAVRRVRVVQSRDTSVGAPRYTHALHDAAGAPKVSLEVTYDLMAYWILKQIAWSAFRDHPLTGAGLGALHADTKRAETEGRIPPGHGDDDPHSTWAGRLGETGLAGTIPLVALWVGAFVCARRVIAPGGVRAALAVPFAAGLVGIALNSPNVDAMHFRFVWIAFGALRSLAATA
jgi:hypothetical protein